MNFFGAKDSFTKGKTELNPRGLFLVHQYGRCFHIVLYVYQYGRYEIYVKTIHTVTIASRIYRECKAGLYICIPHLPAFTTNNTGSEIDLQTLFNDTFKKFAHSV